MVASETGRSITYRGHRRGLISGRPISRLSDQVGKGMSGDAGRFAGFSERNDSPDVEGHGEFASKSGFDLRDGKPQAACDVFRHIRVVGQFGMV